MPNITLLLAKNMLIIKRDLADRWFCLLFSQNCAKTFEIETIQYFVIFHVCEFYLNSVELQSSNNSDYSLDRRFRSFWKMINNMFYFFFLFGIAITCTVNNKMKFAVFRATQTKAQLSAKNTIISINIWIFNTKLIPGHVSRVMLYNQVARGDMRNGMSETRISSMANRDPSSMGGSKLEIVALVMMGTTPHRMLARGDQWAHQELNISISINITQYKYLL